MVVAQRVKETEITEQDSLLLTRNLLRIAIFNISYIRGLFPEKYFNDKSVPALEMKIKKLLPLDAESRRLVDWMEKGVYDALQKKYLRTLLFCICETTDGSTIEEYAFSFSYSNVEGQEVSMNINRTGNKKQGGTFKCNSTEEVTPKQMKSSACKMIRTLVQLMRTLDKMPEERTILMKLLYYDDVMPADYEPPFFRSCTAEETHNRWTRNPLKMEVGKVNSKHLVLSLKVKSVLDPCEDDEENQDDSASLGADSVQRDDSLDSDSEDNSSQEDQDIVASIDTQQPCQEDTRNCEGNDDTEDPEEDEHQLKRVKEWISSCRLKIVETVDVLTMFPNISVVLIEEIMDKLSHEGFLSETGKDTYAVIKKKDFEYEFNVKEEIQDQRLINGDKAEPASGEDYLYMEALYHTLPMDYITIAKLQRQLDGKANLTTARKLIDKMSREGFVEATSNRKLGKRVIHSDLTENKLTEVRKALDVDAMDVDTTTSQDKLDHVEHKKTGNSNADMSTCGVLHSIGSDLTRMRVRSQSEMLQNDRGSTPSDQSVSKTRAEPPNTSSSKAGPIASRESIMPGQSEDKRCRKASTVKEPILQYSKRQKSQAV